MNYGNKRFKQGHVKTKKGTKRLPYQDLLQSTDLTDGCI